MSEVSIYMTRERWIDIAKTIAIIGVLTDHLKGTLYSTNSIQRISFFSVTLFILLMGITTYNSFDTSLLPIYKKVIKRIVGIVLPYIIACFVFCVAIDRGFDWNNFWTRLINFNASGAHYFVLLYIQLIILAPLLFYFLKLTNRIKNRTITLITEIFLGGGGIACVAWICNTHSKIAEIYASKLFGGSYLLVLYIGLLVGKYYQNIINMSKRLKVITGVVAFIFLISIQHIIIYDDILKKDVILGSSLNPPGVIIIIYSFIVMMFIYYSERLVTYINNRFLNVICTLLGFIGKHTLYIFLYHLLFRSILNHFISGWNAWLKTSMYYLVLIIGPIIIEMIIKKMKEYIIDSYLYRRELANGKDNA